MIETWNSQRIRPRANAFLSRAQSLDVPETSRRRRIPRSNRSRLDDGQPTGRQDRRNAGRSIVRAARTQYRLPASSTTARREPISTCCLSWCARLAHRRYRTPGLKGQSLIIRAESATEGPDTWGAYVIVGHLVHGERANWIPRARFILSQSTSRRLPPYDRFAHFHESQGKPLSVLLDELGRLRAENLTTLAAWRLTDTELALAGEHPEFGTVTLRQLLATWVGHDLGHIAQTVRVMAKQYRDAIGPWRAYSPIVDR
jgi:hypothetical protein